MSIALLFMTGLMAGSFLTACSHRLPRQLSLIRPASHCPLCLTGLTAADLVPLLSYLRHRGRCRHCAGKISWQYPAIEAATALLFVWCLHVFGVSLQLFYALLLTAFFVLITVIDCRHQLIFDKVLIVLAATGCAYNTLTGAVSWLEMLLSALAGGGFLLLLAIISQGMGAGDIKFAAALGVCLGAWGLLTALLLSFLSGGIISLLLLLSGRKQRKDFIPYGPFIAAGAFISLLYGPIIVSWYLGRLSV